MTKATVSRRIAELEQRLGVRLLYRSTRQLTPDRGRRAVLSALQQGGG